MPLILPGNVASALPTGFDVTNSVRFNPPDAPYFAKTPTGDGNQRTFTISVWLKMDIHASGATHKVFETGTSTNYFTIYFTTEPYLYVKGRVSSSNVLELVPSKAFRDPTAWFHLYVAVDTTISSPEADRCKIYINGTRVTDFGTATYPSQNTDFENQDASEPFEIGVNHAHGSDEHFDGYMAEYMYVDGAVQAIGDFGEFSEDSPTIWIPKDISGIDVNPGAAQASNGNGFYLDFKDSSNLGNDVGVNAGTDFSVNNLAAVDQATDTPTNNFCTLNPLYNQTTDQGVVLTEGNLVAYYSVDSSRSAFGTIPVINGKWYFEVKLTSVGRSPTVGICDIENWGDINEAAGNAFHDDAENFAYGSDGQKYSNGGSSFGNSFTANDIIGVAVDCTNHKLYFSKNGTWQDSGDPTSGATGTGAAFTITTGGVFVPAVRVRNGTQWAFNFGGCSAFTISSGNTDGTYGNFEYAPPSGYYALCTKNLAEYG